MINPPEQKQLYHGTTQTSAVNIQKANFYESRKPTEWLGRGVYFFELNSDAKKWARSECNKPKNLGEQPAILAADVNYSANEFFDLDIISNMHKMSNEMITVLHSMGKNREGAARLVGKNQAETESLTRHFCCNYYRKKHSQIKVLAYSFPASHTNIMGFPYSTKQRQYCVTDLSRIAISYMEVIDYAV
jgi:hypothetical protein